MSLDYTNRKPLAAVICIRLRGIAIPPVFCVFPREFPLACIIRLWDTYIAEQADEFSVFHVYVCAGKQLLLKDVGLMTHSHP